MVLVQKWPFFQLFFKGNIGQENVFYDILERKNAFLGYKNNKFKKSRFWSKNGHFSNFFFLGNIRQENVFYDILQRKNAFLAIKTSSSKSPKIEIFQKGLTHASGPKRAIFPIFFLGNIGQENVSYDILERKNAFLDYKINKFKKSKNWDFSKGVNPRFWYKNGHFCNFF